MTLVTLKIPVSSAFSSHNPHGQGSNLDILITVTNDVPDISLDELRKDIIKRIDHNHLDFLPDENSNFQSYGQVLEVLQRLVNDYPEIKKTIKLIKVRFMDRTQLEWLPN